MGTIEPDMKNAIQKWHSSSIFPTIEPDSVYTLLQEVAGKVAAKQQFQNLAKHEILTKLFWALRNFKIVDFCEILNNFAQLYLNVRKSYEIFSRKHKTLLISGIFIFFWWKCNTLQ